MFNPRRAPFFAIRWGGNLLDRNAEINQRRLLLFKAHWQALQLFAIFMAAHGLLWLLYLAGGGQWPGAGLWWAPVLETILWPILDRVLLAPQRRAPDRDLTRPL